MASESSSSFQIRCFSYFRRFECEHHWTIRNFKRTLYEYYEEGRHQALVSSPFAVDSERKIIWKLKIYKICESGNESHLIFQIESDNESRKSRNQIHYSCTFKRTDGEKNYEINGWRMFVGGWGYNYHLGMRKLERNGTLRDDEDITISCKIIISTTDNCLPFKPNNGIPKIEQDLISLLDSGKFSDVLVEANGVCFKAHKAILAARSPYFEAMLTHDTIEAGTSHVKVSDIEPEVMRAILKFVYSATIDLKSFRDVDNNQNSDKNSDDVIDTETQKIYRENRFVIDLLVAADKCLLDDLKQICEFALIDIISLKSAVDLLKLAHLYRAANLKNRVIQFMIDNGRSFFNSKRLRELIRENPELSTGPEDPFEAFAFGREPPTTRLTSKSETSRNIGLTSNSLAAKNSSSKLFQYHFKNISLPRGPKMTTIPSTGHLLKRLRSLMQASSAGILPISNEIYNL